MDNVFLLSWTSTPSPTSGGEELINAFVSSSAQVLDPTTFSWSRSDSLASLSSLSLPFYVIVFLRILCIIWVIKDSSYRSHHTWFVIFSLILVTLGTPLIGLPLYLALRPLGYKYERAYRKAIMTQEDLVQEYNSEFVSQQVQEDNTHLEQLQEQASVSKKRIRTDKKVWVPAPKQASHTNASKRSSASLPAKKRKTPTRS